jgi:hypothetical protein
MLDALENPSSTRFHDFLTRLWKTTGAQGIESVYLGILNMSWYRSREDLKNAEIREPLLCQ